jgi:hypothetical protein
MRRAIKIVVILAVLAAVGLALHQSIWKWGIKRVWCPAGKSLMISRKTGVPAPKERYARTGEQGVLEQMAGPGRSFFNTWY